MVRSRKLWSVLGLALLVWSAWRWYGDEGGPGMQQARGVVGRVETEAVPRIDLERLDQVREPTALGQRDLFAYGPPPTVPACR